MASRSLPRAPAKLDQSSQALLDKLDRLLQGCSTPREVDCAHGEDYTKGLDELKKVYGRQIMYRSIYITTVQH